MLADHVPLPAAVQCGHDVHVVHVQGGAQVGDRLQQVGQLVEHPRAGVARRPVPPLSDRVAQFAALLALLACEPSDVGGAEGAGDAQPDGGPARYGDVVFRQRGDPVARDPLAVGAEPYVAGVALHPHAGAVRGEPEPPVRGPVRRVGEPVSGEGQFAAVTLQDHAPVGASYGLPRVQVDERAGRAVFERDRLPLPDRACRAVHVGERERSHAVSFRVSGAWAMRSRQRRPGYGSRGRFGYGYDRRGVGYCGVGCCGYAPGRGGYC